MSRQIPIVPVYDPDHYRELANRRPTGNPPSVSGLNGWAQRENRRRLTNSAAGTIGERLESWGCCLSSGGDCRFPFCVTDGTTEFSSVLRKIEEARGAE